MLYYRLFFLCLVPVVFGWGPISHFYFTCLALNQEPGDCIRNVANHPTLQGSATPDAFAFSASSFQYNSVCPPDTEGIQLHNLVFAGYMVQHASDDAVKRTLLGFGAHMVADMVGFSDQGGYLSSGLDTKYGNINWLTMQPKMQSIDSYLLHTLQLAVDELPQVPISTPTAAFIARSTLEYRQQNPEFPVFDSTVITDCTTSWASMIKRLYNYYTNAITVTTYQQQMVYFDQNNSQNFMETEAFLLKNAVCAGSAIEYWWNEIQLGISPDKAQADLQLYITAMYQSGICN